MTILRNLNGKINGKENKIEDNVFESYQQWQARYFPFSFDCSSSEPAEMWEELVGRCDAAWRQPGYFLQTPEVLFSFKFCRFTPGWLVSNLQMSSLTRRPCSLDPLCSLAVVCGPRHALRIVGCSPTRLSHPSGFWTLWTRFFTESYFVLCRTLISVFMLFFTVHF